MIYSISCVDSKATNFGNLLNGGYIDIYDDTELGIPTDPSGAMVGLRLGRLRFQSPAFSSPVNGLITANPITPDSDADNTGTATYFLLRQSDDSPVAIGTVGTEMILTDPNIVIGGEISCSGFTYQEPQ